MNVEHHRIDLGPRRQQRTRLRGIRRVTQRTTRAQAHARITIDSFEEGGRIWYRVSDNGAGFDMARAQHLFQPFHRLHADSEFAGTGVGLSIARRIVEAHGGSIRARSSPQTGTVMEFTLAAAVN